MGANRTLEPSQNLVILVPNQLTQRPSTMSSSLLFRRLALRPSTFALARAPLYRQTYATTTKGDTQSATSLGTPSPKPSDSQAEGSIKSKRATDRPQGQESGSSVAQPVSQKSEGWDEEGDAPVKRDPSKPAEQKRKEVEKEGQTPLDAADK